MAKRKSILPDGAEAALLFYEGQYRFVSRSPDGDAVKFLGPDAVAQAFTRESVDSGWLGPEIVRTGRTARGPFAVAFLPESAREIVLDAVGDRPRMTIAVPVPALVAVGSSYGLHLVAVDDDAFSPNLTCYYPPFPNLYTESRVCWGANRQPRVDAANLVTAVDLFFGTAFNRNEAAGRSLKYSKDVVDHLERLSRRRARAYPVDDLVPLKPKVTVKRFVERILDPKRGGLHWD